MVILGPLKSLRANLQVGRYAHLLHNARTARSESLRRDQARGMKYQQVTSLGE
jgi:hypothetical protein